MLDKVHHIGYMVEDLEQAIAFAEKALGAQVKLRSRLEDRGLSIAFVDLGPTMLELMQADRREGQEPTRGMVLDHIAYGVADLGRTMAELGAKGIKVGAGYPRPSLVGKQMAFLDSAATMGTRIQIVESS